MSVDLKPSILGAVTKHYRQTKRFLLEKQPPIVTPLFFWLLEAFDSLLSARKVTPAERSAKSLWKQSYHGYYDHRPEERLTLVTDHPIALSSDDHKHPRGTIFDNSINPRFNAQLYRLLAYPERISVLDMGCAGGGLVKSFLEDGHLAIGLEGSDISQRLRSGEWDTIPYHLFTCDITKPFRLADFRQQPVLFDVITAWEVLEHIPEESVLGVIENIRTNLRPGGYLFCSIDLFPDGNPLTGAVYHKTLQPREWWRSQFTSRGFAAVFDHGFASADMVRGNGLSLKDWRPEDGGGIHLVLQKS